MTIFSQRKDRGPIEPEPCARCRARPGTAWLDFLSADDGDAAAIGARRTWLCTRCREEVQRDAGDN